MNAEVPFASVRPGEWFDVPRLKSPPPFLVGHWSAGSGGATRIYHVLENRGLSVHFSMDQDGSIVQQAPLDGRCAHAGSRGNVGLGIEVSNRGLPPKGAKAPILTVPTIIRGRRVNVIPFTADQEAKWVELAEWCAAKFGWPRQVPNETRVLTMTELRRWRGCLEHLHISPRKIDSGGLLCAALVRAGWKAVDPASQ
jgi:N-acetyl-anhydromuramyl-L-alanine amidase AmpD